MENKKFELTEETLELYGHTLYRIKALKDFSVVHKGDLGGWVEKEDNLSQYGDCWIGDDAKVWGNAEVYGDAYICDDAKVYDNAKVYDGAIVSCNAEVHEEAQVFGDVTVYDDANVCGKAKVFGDTTVYGYTKICGDAEVKSIDDYMVFHSFWNIGRWLTWTRSNDMWKEGLFYGTGDELVKETYKLSDEIGRKYEAAVNYINSIFH